MMEYHDHTFELLDRCQSQQDSSTIKYWSRRTLWRGLGTSDQDHTLSHLSPFYAFQREPGGSQYEAIDRH